MPEYDTKQGRHPSGVIAVCAESILILRDTYRLLWGEGDLSGTKLEEKNKEMNKYITTAHRKLQSVLTC